MVNHIVNSLWYWQLPIRGLMGRDSELLRPYIFKEKIEMEKI
jgi:hypothetical protein